MEGYIGEIRAFGGNFAPVNWLFCQGQSMQINEYTTLFTVIGTIYGGDGVTTYNLPNIASRTVVGAGQGTGLSAYNLGQISGEESHSLTVSELPTHNHQASATFSTTAGSAEISLNAVAAPGLEASPVGNYLAQDSSGTDNIYASEGSSTNLVSLNSKAAQVSKLSPPLATVNIGIAGSSVPHNNIQPVLAVNYIICIEGIYPSRN
ncbi:phage tail protein [Pedobacter sp. MR22-3]|uniref:phage tail protein n=1 Tax=Pedobacter TaxID=84567 RepID=UPI002246571F|nr:tail fiber protein [Pedobacter sp. MR22-3]MCX2583533.1 tail fiber protein [Pedobacter sp. MR22-3]